MQQGSGSGSGMPTGPSSGFASFGRPQAASASSSSAPPNTFFQPPAASSAFSGFSSGGQQPSGFSNPRPPSGQQQPGFGNPRPFNARPQSQTSGFGAPRPSKGGNVARPFNAGHIDQSQQQQQSTFGNRPRPFTARSGGMGQEGRPPQGSFRGGRGGATIRPARPFPSQVNQQPAPADGAPTGPSNANAPRPRPRPFANRSTTFNTQPQPSPAFGGQSGGQAPATPSAFGAQSSGPTSAASPAFGTSGPAQGHTASFTMSPTPSTSVQQGSAFTSSQATSSFGQGASASGPASSNLGAPSTAFGSATATGSSQSFGSTPSSSAFGAPASSSAFGANASTSSFGSAFSASQSPATTTAPTSSAPAIPMHSGPPASAPSASTAPTSSFSNFLRKDRNGAATLSEGFGAASTPGGDASKGLEDEDELRKKRFEDAPKVGNRFLEMKGGREALRNAYIKSGVLPDPDKPTDLALAVNFVGTCQDMCPEFEREEREFQKELDPLEVYPGTDRVDPRIAVKIYRRPAAGRELPLPEDVRPPPVLKRTLDYLFHDLLPADPRDPKFTQVQGFLWNRTRAVRQDFIVQSEGGAIAIECHERIARYHILCLHWRGGPGAEGWSEQQELEQLRKTMRSLIEFYDDNRRKSSATGVSGSGSGYQPSPNEAEFRAYNLLLHLRDPETLREAELLPGATFRSPLVQTALNLRQLAQRSNNLEKRGQPRNTEGTLNFFSKFFAELRKPNVNYLMACLAENSFSSIRIGALKSMGKAYMAQHRALPIEKVQHVLGMDSAEQVVAMATHLGIELEYDTDTPVGVKIHRSANINEDKPLIAPFSASIVEAKRGSYTSADVVDGRASGASAILSSSDQSHGQTPATPSANPSFGKQAQASSSPSFGFKPQQASALGQQQLAQDASKSSPFGSAPQSKLSAAAPTFTPTTVGAFGSGDSSSTANQSSTFGGFSAFTADSSKKNDSATSTSSSIGAFGNSTAFKQEKKAADGLFGGKANSASNAQAPQSKPSSQPSFSFGQLASKSLVDQPTDDITGSNDQKPAASAASSFSFGASAKADSGSAKPSMPSFFGSSLGSNKEATADEASTKPSVAASFKAADTNEDSTTTSQKRRASDAQEKAAAQAAAAAAKAKAEAEAKAKVQRKEANRKHAVERALEKLSNEAVRSAAAKVAASAVQEEEARRRASSRNELLGRVADELWQRLADEQAAEEAERASRIAAAEVFRTRSVAMRAWQRWTEALEQRRDREHQRQRLEDIRSEIRRRNILARVQADADGHAVSTPAKAIGGATQSGKQTSPISRAFSIRQSLLTGERTPLAAQGLKRKLGDEMDVSPDRAVALQDDADLTERWTRIRRRRNQLWAEGSLLERLADHIKELLLQFRPADLDRLVVLYSGAPNQHVASSWLRVKFGFSPSAPNTESDESENGRDVLEIELADGSQLELVDVTLSSGSQSLESILSTEADYSHVGLVIFETNPAAVQARTEADRRSMFASDRKRLEEIAGSKLVQNSHLACRLLVVSWGELSSSSDGSEDVDMADANSDGKDAKQRTLIDGLGLDLSASAKHSSLASRTFDRVGVLELDDASVSVEDTLASLLPRAMPDLSLDPKLLLNGARRLTLEELVRDFYEQWARTSTLLLNLLTGVPPSLLSSAASEGKVERLACKSLKILVALANHILRTILSLSETILEDDNEERSVELPSPSSSTADKVVDMAFSQLDQLPEDESEEKMYLRSRLFSSLQATGSSTPALIDVIPIVIGKHVEELFRVSLSKLDSVWIGPKPEKEAERAQTKETFARLCSAAVDEVAAETRSLWAEYRASIGGSAKGDRPGSPSKRIRTEPHLPSPDAHPASPAKSSSKVNDLRDLIARTKRFLDQLSSLS